MPSPSRSTRPRPAAKRPSDAQPDPAAIHPTLERLRRPVTELSVDPANLRLHPPESIRAIKASLQRFGQRTPIVVDGRGVTVAGAGRLQAALELGWRTIAAARQDDLTGAERIAYAIADNRSAELSAWDAPGLASTLRELPAELLAAAGYTAAQLAELLDPAPTIEDAPVATHPPAVAKPGDLWILGEHRLLCGDSTRAADVDRVLAGEQPRLCATDPPYVVDYTGNDRNGSGKDWSGVYREIDIPDASAFFRALLTQIVRVIEPGAAVYCWHASKRYPELVEAWRASGLLDHQIIIWVKPSAAMGHSFWRWRHEPCLMGWRQGTKPRHDGRHEVDSVWPIGGDRLEDLSQEQLLALVKASTDVWEVDWEGKGRVVGNEHPTQKPVELFARPMRKHTAAGDVVFEPFSGSGSQLIAAEQLGRRCRAIEIQPLFVDAAVRRWEAFTGKAARLEGGGTSAEVAADRLRPARTGRAAKAAGTDAARARPAGARASASSAAKEPPPRRPARRR